jgi:hypothetical protein
MAVTVALAVVTAIPGGAIGSVQGWSADPSFDFRSFSLAALFSFVSLITLRVVANRFTVRKLAPAKWR